MTAYYGGVRGDRRAEPPSDPRSAARAGATGRRARARAGAVPARGLEAPAGAAGGRPRRRHDRRPAPALPHPAGAAAGDRRVADAVPGRVARPARRARAAPRRDARLRLNVRRRREPMTDRDLGTLAEHEGEWQVRFERRLRHPLEKVWRAVTEPEHMQAWFPDEMEGERRAGAPLKFVDKGMNMT